MRKICICNIHGDYKVKQKKRVFTMGMLKKKVKGSNINIAKEQLTDFCRRHHIRKLSLFGSVLSDNFHADSDVDVLVEFEPDHIPGFAFFKIELELSKIFNRKVDLHTPNFLSRYFRNEVLKQAKVFYVQP